MSHELRFLLAAQKCAELIRRVGKAALGRIDGFLRDIFQKVFTQGIGAVHVSGIRFHKGNRNICFFQPGQQLAQSLLRQRVSVKAAVLIPAILAVHHHHAVKFKRQILFQVMQVVRRTAGCQVKLHPFGAQNVERRHGRFRQVVIRRQQSAVNIKKSNANISVFHVIIPVSAVGPSL